jgi:3',5'-cyclic AMP phosphodiesterase CpdA
VSPTTVDVEPSPELYGPLGVARPVERLAVEPVEPVEPERRTLTIAVVSDLNDAYGSVTYGREVHDAVGRILDVGPDLVLSTGDMVAGQRAGLDYPAMWRGFHGAVTDPLAAASIPFAPTPGNHDASGYRVFAEEREIYVRQWNRRKPDLAFLDDRDWPLRYSFVMGAALFVSLDATTVGPLGAGQKRWLAEQLEAGAAQPVKIVYGHVPLWAFAEGRETEILADAELEDLLVEHRVSVMLSGHHHAYYPGRRGGLRLVGQACLGGGPRTLLGESLRSGRSITVITLDESGLLDVDAYAAPDFDRIVDRATLPETVEHAGEVIARDDL